MMRKIEELETSSFLWLDFEFTGLDDSRDLVIEAAAVSTEGLFKVKDEFTTFIRYTDDRVAELLQRNPWWLDRPDHMRTMLQSSQEADRDLPRAAIDLAAFAAETKSGPELYLAGNSIHVDRKWVKRDFPALERQLHYRMLDVSSFKLFVTSSLGIEYVKEEKHRALDDIHESIDELYYLSGLLTK